MGLGDPTIEHISPLAGLPLEWLQLERFVFTPGNIEAGIEHARNMRSLRQIGTSFGEESKGREGDVLPSGEFWELYDAGRFK